VKDRNFDDLAARFAHRVYGGLKGEIRLAVLWRDIERYLAAPEQLGKQLNILDIGGGLGQLSIRLAQLGHHVVFNDLSQTMLASTQQNARDAGVEAKFIWQHGAYQDVFADLPLPPDLILCHALVEWLAEPEKLLPALSKCLRKGGSLSICFYNPAAKVYRNLIRGNFDWLKQQHDYQSDSGSLTPNNPTSIPLLRQWLADQGFSVGSESGIRVFHDYVVERRGGHQSAEEVLAMELEYSDHSQFKEMGRYFHILAQLD